ncbi:MAG: flagellar biosynthesis protein FlhF [Treponema sp.]|jgi:flagellar biosynthesis protein FlhF|nr:flagellar biosynthesis protein FlhF [Treponema sp.]
MEQFTEEAPTYQQCYEKIRSKYGDRARVLIQKTVRMRGLPGLFGREGVELSGYISNGDLPKYNYNYQTGVRKPVDLKGQDLEEQKKKLLAAAGKSDPTLELVLSTVKDIKKQMEEVNAPAKTRQVLQDHPTLVRLEAILNQNDFTPNYRKETLDRAKKEFSLEALEDFDTVQETVLEWIGESIRIHKEEEFQRRPRIVTLIGPTGVGKTTTIAKLAAIYGTEFSGRRPLSVQMITIDGYRIGAEHQIETYGGIMGIPVSSVKNYRELKETIALNSESTDLILIDTMGRSPRASVELAEMKELLDACGSAAEYHLALAASTKSGDILEILKQFEPFGYRSVIITKMDETFALGNVISALAERGKQLSYITEGQHVPNDIQKASVLRFLINLEGFKINRLKIEERFPNDEAELIRWT